MTRMRLSEHMDTDIFAANVLVRLLKKTNDINPMFVKDVLEALNEGGGQIPRLQYNAVMRLESDYVNGCKRTGLEEQPHALTTSDGFLSEFFRTFLQLSIAGKFPDYRIVLPTPRNGKE